MYANNLDDAFSVFASGTTEEWVKSDKYMDYPKYHDEDYTYIEGRTIGDIAAQISVQGEAYSQYISFMMDRYYDGIDLMGMSIWIHYELKDGSGSEDSPVNVMYNDSTIRFNWIVPEKATQQSGDIKIGVWVNGTAPNTKAYILKTEEKIYTIHSGLIPGSGITQPDQNWFENFVEQMDSKVSTAQGHANDAQASKTAAAGSAAASAQSATASAQALADNKAYVESQKAAFVGYNKRETDLRYANALIGSASDTTQVTVDDAWEAPIPGMEIAGKSEQFSTTGAQLLDLSAVSTSAGGAVINTADGGYQISGTGALTEAFIASYQLDYLKNHLKPGNLILKSELTMPKLYVRIWDGSTVLAEMQGNSTKQITQEMINNENMRVECFLYGSAGSIITPGTYHPMLYQDGDGTWEPYTGGRPSPSPEYPQEIVSTDVTAVTVTGANLLIPKISNNGTRCKASLTEDGMVLIKGISKDSEYNDLYLYGKWGNSEDYGLRGTYTISCTHNGLLKLISITNHTSTIKSTSKNECTFTVTDENPINGIFIRLYPNTTYDCTLKIMLNIGDTALPWEPYRSKTAAITLTEPLRGIWDVRDRIMCRDGVWGVERAINQIDDTGTVPISEALQVLAVPTWEPLPSDTQAALNTLTTYKGRTTIAVTAEGPEPDVAVEYVQDTNVVIAELKKLIEGIQNVES